MKETTKCNYCGLRFKRHNLQELEYCFNYMAKKLDEVLGN